MAVKACFAQGVALETPAARFIAEMVIAHPGEISILALGPLTNIALSMQYDPRVASHMVRCRTRTSPVSAHFILLVIRIPVSCLIGTIMVLSLLMIRLIDVIAYLWSVMQLAAALCMQIFSSHPQHKMF